MFNDFDIYERAVPYALDLLEEYGQRATLFVVGRDLIESKFAIKVLKKAVYKGHKIGNHTMNHSDGFHRMTDFQRANEIIECHRLILDKLSVAPISFRAPGYSNRMTDYRLIRDLGYGGYFSPTSLLYTTVLDAFFRLKKISSKRFPTILNIYDLLEYMKFQCIYINRNDSPLIEILNVGNICTVHFSLFSTKHDAVSRRVVKRNRPLLFHAVDFVDLSSHNSPYPALQLDLIHKEKIIRNLIEIYIKL